MQEHRVFVEWESAGVYVSSLHPDFQAALVDMVGQHGPPSKVEFRAHGEGWVEAQPCESCGESLVDCHCGEVQCSSCGEWYASRLAACPFPHP